MSFGCIELNGINEELTVATLPPFAKVNAQQMIATVKVIPFCTNQTDLDACAHIAHSEPLLRIAAFKPRSAGLIQTRLSTTKESVLDKSTTVLRERLERLGSHLIIEKRCSHDSASVAQAVEAMLEEPLDMVLIAGASAIVDRRDVIPAGIALVGGSVEHFGMPVDPGNLLLLAHKGPTTVVGLPGCARSPKPSGFDSVLQRMVAGVPVHSSDIMRMGSGGLLKELGGRIAPRAREEHETKAPARAARIAAIVLAAGQSRRMGATKQAACPRSR